ncbi:MAG TPA: alanine racemase [Kaistia sp.]|nr:alanine racemase [Kaistia sp.]
MESIEDAAAEDWGSGGRLTVDLSALARNWRSIADRAGGAETAAAVKGDAYGIGLAEAVPALAKAGCRSYFVALPQEGLQLRTLAPAAAIYVLNGLIPGTAARLAERALQPVLGSMAEIDEWAAYKAAGGDGRAALHVDTGMHRLGVTLDEAAGLADRAEALGLSLVMSHLACADQPDHPLNAAQLAAFRTASRFFPGLPASLANSAGLHLSPDYHFDLVRPGIALYGGRFGDALAALEPVVCAEARIVQIRQVAVGQSVGYGATQHVTRPSRIAILSAGYADGYHRMAGSSDNARGASAFLHGRRAPLIGRISMDLLAIDVTDIPEARRGDHAELFGPNIPVDEVAAHAGTIGYELLTSLGKRYRRHYLGGA